jgi:ADP-ribose pyrophosphatase
MDVEVSCSFIPLDYRNKKILIAKRSMDKKIFPGAWENIGGRLEGEETLDECVEREVFEEIGCSPLWLKQIKTKISKYESKNT